MAFTPPLPLPPPILFGQCRQGENENKTCCCPTTRTLWLPQSIRCEEISVQLPIKQVKVSQGLRLLGLAKNPSDKYGEFTTYLRIPTGEGMGSGEYYSECLIDPCSGTHGIMNLIGRWLRLRLLFCISS